MPQIVIQNIKKIPVNILAGIYIILNPLIDIITSKTDKARSVAMVQLEGFLSKKIENIQILIKLNT